MKLLKFILILGTLPLFIACDAFEKPGDIKDFMGNYVVESASEKKYHVAWNQETLISEKNINPPIGTKINILADSTVEYIALDGKVSKGKVKCLERYVRFINTPIDKTYKFYLMYNSKLYYSYESKHASVEYDVTYRSITLTRSY